MAGTGEQIPDESLARFERWAVNYRGLAPQTLQHYLGYLKRTTRWLQANKGLRLESAAFADLETFLFSELAGGSSRRNCRCAFMAYWDFLRHEGHAPEIPVASLPKAKQRKGRAKPITEEQLRALLEEARKPTRTGNHLKWECLVTVLAGTGLRLSEGTFLRWDAIRGQRADLIQKGNRERTVFLCAPVADVLARWRQQCPNDKWVFPSPVSQGSPISKGHAYKKIRELGDKVGIIGLHPHQLRHTFATLLYEATGDIMKVKVALGHEQIANTMIYTQINSKDVQEAVEALPFWESAKSLAGLQDPGEARPLLQKEYLNDWTLKDLLSKLGGVLQGPMETLTPAVIRDLSRQFVVIRSDLEREFDSSQREKFRFLQRVADEIRGLELIFRGRAYLLAGSSISDGGYIDAQSIAQEAAESIDAYAIRNASQVISFLGVPLANG